MKALASLFRYPDGSLVHQIEEARRASDPALDAFAADMAALNLAEQQSAYTATFDLAPACPPYLGVHLFGDENPDRARLMIGLRLAYKRIGFDTTAGELPDHVAEVLAFTERADGDEREDLRLMVLLPALTKMDAILATTLNPYRHLIASALHRVSAGAS